MADKKMVVYGREGYMGVIVDFNGKRAVVFDENDGSQEKYTLEDLKKYDCKIEIE